VFETNFSITFSLSTKEIHYSYSLPSFHTIP
jgi:hypothetical protein